MLYYERVSFTLKKVRMILLVTEKPDAAKELAGYLSRKLKTTAVRSKRYIEVGDHIVTFARGHLLSQLPPDAYLTHIPMTPQNSKNGSLYWDKSHLPIIPAPFKYEPSATDADRAAQLKEIGRLMKSADVIYNAADLDREGQLIFDEIADYFDITGKKKIMRIMFSALDDTSFDRAFAAQIDNNHKSVKNKGIAAKARGQADWLIGMNCTRAATIAHRSGKGAMNIGRVTTPTMAIVVRRFLEIQNFKPRAFYTPTIELADGTVLKWTRRINSDGEPGFDEEGRIIDKSVADAIVRAINAGLNGEITESKSIEKSEEPPLPFSLPSIQSELSRKHGLTVDQITNACQSLYEKKMQTYIGTDCRFLPEAMHGEAKDVLSGLRSSFSKAVNTANLSKKYACWNDKKLTGEGAAAHHGIIPTGSTGVLENEAERIVYSAVCRRYISQFHEEYRYLSIMLKSTFGADEFTASATAPISMGWKEVEEVDVDGKKSTLDESESSDDLNDLTNKSNMR